MTVLDVFEAVGALRGGQDDARSSCAELEGVACPGAGACGGQYTANTMAMAIEMHGHVADGQRLRAGDGPARRTTSPSRSGKQAVEVLRRNICARAT